MPSTTRQMTIPHLGFVGGLLYAVRKAGRAPPPEPPDHLRCPISCDLYDDPVLLSQTGHTYDRVSIERWLRQKSPPTDPASNVELHSTATVPNWALRDAVNEWRAQNGNAPLQAPECATRRLAGGANARDGLSVGFAGVSLPGFGLNNVWAHGTNTVLGGTPQNVAFALRPVRLALLGVCSRSRSSSPSVVAAVSACAESSASFSSRVAGAPPHAAAPSRARRAGVLLRGDRERHRARGGTGRARHTGLFYSERDGAPHRPGAERAVVGRGVLRGGSQTEALWIRSRRRRAPRARARARRGSSIHGRSGRAAKPAEEPVDAAARVAVRAEARAAQARRRGDRGGGGAPRGDGCSGVFFTLYF